MRGEEIECAVNGVGRNTGRVPSATSNIPLVHANQPSRQIKPQEGIDRVVVKQGMVSATKWRELFGFENVVIYLSRIKAPLDLGGTVVEPISYDGEPAPKNEGLGYRMMALEADDKQKATGYLRVKGVEVVWDPSLRETYTRAEIRDPNGLSHRASAVVPMSASGIPPAARLELPIKIPVSIGFSPSRTTVVAWFPAMRLLAWNIRQGSGSRPPRIAKALKQRYSKYQPLAWRASAWHYHGISGASLCRE